ncbi:MAG TPA: DUF1273 family protein [Candidatus Enterenecus merdae]|nr:DUF1273 family protein [Candidatus Enterenecus merdae]
MTEERTCCFTGHRPGKLPWGWDEDDPRCQDLKGSIARELDGLYRRGYRHFLSGMAQGCDLYFAEAVLALRQARPDVTLEGAVPFPGQADRWPPQDRLRWRAVLDACDVETVVQQRYDRFCMLRRDRYLVDRSGCILAVFDGSPGGTRYTLNYAMNRQLEVLLLDLNRPQASAVRLAL